MANLQWLPGMQYAFILISNSNTYDAEHQTHIWHYRRYHQEPILANRDYDYIRHTKPRMSVTTPNITYAQSVELSERFYFYPTSFATIDLSKVPHLIPEEEHVRYIVRNPTFKISFKNLRKLKTWELNPNIKPETIFENVKYDEEGCVISVGKQKIKEFDPYILTHNPNFYCFRKRIHLMNLNNPPAGYNQFNHNSANRSKNYLGYTNSNRLIHAYTDIIDVHDFIVKPIKPDMVYQLFMNKSFNKDNYLQIFNHFIKTESFLWWDIVPHSPCLFQRNKKQIYLHIHPDPVKYNIDQL